MARVAALLVAGLYAAAWLNRRRQSRFARTFWLRASRESCRTVQTAALLETGCGLISKPKHAHRLEPMICGPQDARTDGQVMKWSSVFRHAMPPQPAPFLPLTTSDDLRFHPAYRCFPLLSSHPRPTPSQPGQRRKRSMHTS